MHPIVCLITDRRRLPDPTAAGLLRQVRAAVRSGVQLIQIRERDLDGHALFELTRQAAVAVRGTSTRVLVNDRLDIALAAGAHGVHLRGHSFPASRVRRVVPSGFLIGQSVHELAEVTAVGPVDYLLFGHVFETTSKPGVAAAGLKSLASVARATPVPVLAVGGVTRERVPQVIETGAAGFAAISLFASSELE